jgi:hypothetical protein
MKRLYAPLMAALACCAAPTVAEAATPPTVPTNFAATVVADGQRAGTVDLAWTASTDADGDAITYDVHSIEGDAVTVTTVTTTSARLMVLRGTAYVLSVRAVDATGARSDLSPRITVTAPPIPVRLVFGISPRGGFAQACAGVSGACAITDRARASVRVHATSTAELAFARVQLTVLWRKPGTTRFVSRPAVIADIAAGSASISLTRIVNASGTWCVRARLAPNAGDLFGRAAFTPTCVRYVAPTVMG